MLSYAPTQDGQTAVVDTFERTSNREILAVAEVFVSSVRKSKSQSEFLTTLDKFDSLGRILNQLDSVPDNWNSYHSPAPTIQSIERGRQILTSLKLERLVPRRILPSAEGGVAFVFMSTTDNRAVIESLNNGETFIFLYDRTGNSKTLDWDLSSVKQQELLDDLRVHLRGLSLATA